MIYRPQTMNTTVYLTLNRLMIFLLYILCNKFPDCWHCLENHQTVRKSSNMTWNLPYCLKTFHSVRKSSRLSENSPDRPSCLGIFQTVRNIFQTVQNIHTVQNFSRLPRNIQDSSEIYKTVWKPSRLYGNLSDYQEIFKTVRISSRLSQTDCQTLQ